jgi:hypothetical protein
MYILNSIISNYTFSSMNSHNKLQPESILLATEVTPGLLAGAEPDAH